MVFAFVFGEWWRWLLILGCGAFFILTTVAQIWMHPKSDPKVTEGLSAHKHDWRDVPGGWQEVDSWHNIKKRGPYNYERPKHGVTFHVLEQVCRTCDETHIIQYEQPPRSQWGRSEFVTQEEFDAYVAAIPPQPQGTIWLTPNAAPPANINYGGPHA